MLTQLLLLILDAVIGFFVIMLLVRFYMQWLRVPFRNPVGQFVVAISDWMVRPARRIVPSAGGLDVATFVLALVLHSGYLALSFWLRGFSFGGQPGLAAIAVVAIGFVELLRYSMYILMGVVIVSAVLSWVNPYSPVAPLFNAMARPFLRPFQRLVPPVSGIDLSPLILILVLQILLIILAWIRTSLIPFVL